VNHLSTLDLHKLRYGELDKARAAELRSHVDTCAGCRDRLQAQHAMRAEFEVLPVPPALRAAARKPRVPAWVWAFVPGLLVAALAFVVVLPPEHGAPPAVEDVRYKGKSAVELLLDGSGVVDPESTRFHAGDRVQVRIAPGPEAQAWVTDGRQILGTFPVEAGKATLAPFSLTLDAEPGSEQLVIVVAREMLRDDEIQRILGGRRMPGVDVTYWELQKTGQ
jgi:hypothetical protein